jgi:hypothetical protein
MLAGGIVVKVAVLIVRRRWRRIRKPEEGRAFVPFANAASNKSNNKWIVCLSSMRPEK